MAESSSKPGKVLSAINLPHDSDAERRVLGAMLLDREIVMEVDQLLEPDDFYEASHRVIYTRMLDLEREGQAIDLALLADRLKRHGELASVGDVVYLAQLGQFALSSSAAPDNARLVREKAVLRRLIGAAESILRESSEERMTANEVVEAAEKAIFEVSRDTHEHRFRPFNELMDESLTTLGDVFNRGAPAEMLQTGFDSLDEKLAGGFERTALAILAARPSVGKTAFALQLLRNLAKAGKPVGFFSLEMGADQLSLRILCSESQVPGDRVRYGKLSQKDWDALRSTISAIHDWPVYIDDQAALNLLQLRSRARRLKLERPNLALLVVDYLQLMSAPPGRRDTNRQQEVSEISRGLKVLAKELCVPILALSQLSRNIEQRKGKDSQRPMLSDLRESGAIEQDADVVMFVHRDRSELDKDRDPERYIPSEIIVGKNRNGPIGPVDFYFDPRTTIFAPKAPDWREEP